MATLKERAMAQAKQAALPAVATTGAAVINIYLSIGLVLLIGIIFFIVQRNRGVPLKQNLPTTLVIMILSIFPLSLFAIIIGIMEYSGKLGIKTS